MTSKEKQEYAYLLYSKEAGLSLADIAERVGVHVNTIGRWKEKFNWEALRKSQLVTRGEQIRRLYDQLDNLTRHIDEKPEGQRYANKSEADTLTQLTRSIANLERDITAADVVDVFIPFISFVAKVDSEKAKIIVELQDKYIKSLIQWALQRQNNP